LAGGVIFSFQFLLCWEKKPECASMIPAVLEVLNSTGLCWSSF